MRTIKFKLVFQISLITSLFLMLCACQMDDGKSAELFPQMEHTQSFDNEYSKALNAYDAFMCGDIGLNNSQIFTIAPTAESKYAILDMNDDGIPELAVTTVIFQERDSDTLELESTSFDSAIFSYKNGEVFIWAGGDCRHNNFEILSNKALLYDCNDGHGGREIIYHELDENGDISCEIEMWNNPDGRYYLIDYAQNDSQMEISEDEWHEIVDPILALRTDLIPWTDWTESLYACQTDGTGHNIAEQVYQSEYQMLAQAYRLVITENDVEDPIFSLIYLDEDNIPELVILDRYWGKYSIYTIRDNSVECIVDSMTTVEMTYYERKNIISAFWRSNGGGDEGEYASSYYQLNQFSQTLVDGVTPSFEFTYHAVYNEKGEWTETGIINYYENGKEIDEAAYNQIFTDFDISHSGDISCFSENNKCFTKDELLMYLDMESKAEVTS